jgi:hypothetical protein
MSLKGRSCWVVNIRMDDQVKLSLEAIGLFVAGSDPRLRIASNFMAGLSGCWWCRSTLSCIELRISVE